MMAWHTVSMAVRIGAAIVCIAACGPVAQAVEWWDQDWPYRMKIEAAAGAGDVAEVTVMLAGRTSEDGRDLRMVTEDGRLHHFEVLHHDPKLSTLLQFQVPPGKAASYWLYYGNPRAHRINTLNPYFAAQQRAQAQWRQQQIRRQQIIRNRQAIEARMAEYRRQLAALQGSPQADSALAQTLGKRLADHQQQLEATPVPAELPAAPSASEWKPRRGVLLRTYTKARQEHPGTIEQLYKLIGRSELQGAGFRRDISDGFNPFGPSDHYAGTYEGYLRIDKPGVYSFCTASDDGSWVFVNDRLLVAWPGGHGPEAGARGEMNGHLRLEPGVAKVRYYHEDGEGGQVAFLGWKPPWAERFSGIPHSQWLSVRQAKAHPPEARHQSIMAVPSIRLFNTYWVVDSDNQQATMIAYDSDSFSRDARITSTVWQFGDGLTSTQTEGRHVYFRNGRPQITLTVRDDQGRTDSVSVSPNIFQVDVVAGHFKYGNAKQYAEAAGGYDVQRMAKDDLRLYAEFWLRTENRTELVRATEAFIARFGDDQAAGRLASAAADACLTPEAYAPERAAELLKLAAPHATTQRARAELEMRRAHVLAWELDKPAEAGEIYQRVRRAIDRRDRLETLIYAMNIGLGDVLLLQSRYHEAEAAYRKAETSAPHEMKEPERAAKIGSYPYMIDDLLARGEYEWALKKLDEWEYDLPVQKLEGYTFFMRGKVCFVQQPGEMALRYLDLAERVAPHALHVPETVWLRANCLMAMRRYDKALAELRRITVDFTDSQYYKMAPAKIAECREKVGS